MKTTPKQRSLKTKQELPEEGHQPRRKAKVACTICGSEAAPFSDEKLCWVCRRLKVSAWGDGPDVQMFAAE